MHYLPFKATLLPAAVISLTFLFATSSASAKFTSQVVSDITITESSLFNVDLEPTEDRELDPSYAQVRIKQTPYFQPEAGRDQRELIFVNGDQTTDQMSGLFRYLANLTNLEGFAKNAKDFHQLNLELASDTLAKIKRNPEEYGISPDEAQSFVDITDINFEFLVNEVIERNSWAPAHYGAAISATIFQSLSERINKGRAFGLAILTSLGPETVLMAYFSYRALQQLYVLHRYYSYMRAVKATLIRQERALEWRAKIATRDFNVDVIKFDEHFTRDIFRGWVLAALMGGVVKNKLARPKVDAAIMRALAQYRLARIQAIRTGKKIPLDAVTSRVLAPVRHILRSRSAGELFQRLFKKSWRSAALLPVKQRQAAEENENSEKKKTNARKRKKILAGLQKGRWLSPQSLAFMGIDWYVTSRAIYALNYFILHYTSQVLTGLHLSPSTNIKMSLIDDNGYNSRFVQGTRKFVYPMCLFLADNAKYSQDPFTPEDSLRKRTACLNLIRAFEGVERNEDIVTVTPKLAPLMKLYEGTKRTTFSSEALDRLIAYAGQFPDSYKVSWLAALRSIFPLDLVPQHYFTLQYRVLSRPEKSMIPIMEWLIPSIYPDIISESAPSLNLTMFTSSGASSAAVMNVERLNYAIEYLASEMTKRSINKAIAEGKITGQEPIKDLTDSRIWKSRPDISDAYILYFNESRMTVAENKEYLKKKAQEGEHRPSILDKAADAFGSIFISEGLALSTIPGTYINWEWMAAQSVDHILDKDIK